MISHFDIIVIAPSWSDDFEAFIAKHASARILAVMPERLPPRDLTDGGRIEFHYLRVSQTPYSESKKLRQFQAPRVVWITPEWRDLEFTRYLLALHRIRSKKRERYADGILSPLGILEKPIAITIRKIWLQRYLAGWHLIRLCATILAPLWICLRLALGITNRHLAKQSISDTWRMLRQIWTHHFLNPQSWGLLQQRPRLIAGYLRSFLLRPANKNRTTDPKRILIVIPDLLGDTMTMIPLARALKSRWPEARLEALVAPKSAELLHGCPYIDVFHTLREYHSFNHHSRPFAGHQNSVDNAIRMLIHSGPFDAVINASFWPERAMIINGIPAGRRISVPSNAILAWDTEFIAAHPSGHIFQMVLSLGASLGAKGIPADAPGTEAEARLWITEAERIEAREKLNKQLGTSKNGEMMIGICTFAPLSSRRYPIETFIESMHYLASRKPTRFVIFDKPNLLYRTADLPPGCIWTGDWPLRQAVAALAEMDLLIANEGGLGHMAYAEGTPCVLIYTSYQPDYWKPGDRAECLTNRVVCSPCAQAFCHRDLACHKGITTEMIITAAYRALARSQLTP